MQFSSNLKVLTAILMATLICVVTIVKLSLFKPFIYENNFDTAIGVILSMLYLCSIIYVLASASLRFSNKFTLWVIFIIGCIGGVVCFASTYRLHGLTCNSGSPLNWADYVHYSSYLWIIREPASQCNTVKLNEYVPTIEALAIGGYMVGSLCFLYKASKDNQ